MLPDVTVCASKSSFLHVTVSPPEVELDLVGIPHYQSGLKNLELSRLLDSVAVPVVVAIVVAVGVVVMQAVVVPLVLAVRRCYCYQRT